MGRQGLVVSLGVWLEEQGVAESGSSGSKSERPTDNLLMVQELRLCIDMYRDSKSLGPGFTDMVCVYDKNEVLG